LVIPAAFFAALDRTTDVALGASEEASNILFTDGMRGNFLKFSRGIAIILLIM
jgi:hypothetical protein